MSLLPVETGQIVKVSTFFEASKELGTGRYAEVYLAYASNYGCDVALKIYRQFDEQTHAEARGEAEILRIVGALNSDYFPKLLHATRLRTRNQQHPVLVLELGSYLTSDGHSITVKLSDILASSTDESRVALRVDPEFYDADYLTKWLIHLFQAVALLHSADVVHRDIKPTNILLKRTRANAPTLPFLLDFNSNPQSAILSRGTPRYLPPEVRAGARSTASPDDDVWAAATVAWELFFGENAAQGVGTPVAPWVRGVPSHLVTSVLLEALATDPSLRVKEAARLADKLEGATRTVSATPKDDVMGSTEFATAQAMVPRIRLELEELLSPPHSIIVPKEITENVRHVLQWLNEDGTQALDLVRELGNFGPKVVPACLSEAHRVPPDSVGLQEIASAIAPVANEAPALAQEAIGWYCTQSSVSVRKMARLLAHKLCVCPRAMLGALNDDTELLLPHERTDIAVLALKYSTGEVAAAAVCDHLAREYFISKSAYERLRREVAVKFCQASFDRRAERIVRYVSRRGWSNLKEFQALPEDEKRSAEKGVVQLFGDAFASLGDEAYGFLSTGRATFDQNSIRWFRTFALKLARQHEPARRGILASAQTEPNNPDFQYLVSQLQTVDPTETTASLERAFGAFMDTGDLAALNQLRFEFATSPALFTLIDASVNSDKGPERMQRVASLLEGFENRQRARVVRSLLLYWNDLMAVNPDATIRAASGNPIPDKLQRDQVVQRLSPLLGGIHEAKVRRGLNTLLEA